MFSNLKIVERDNPQYKTQEYIKVMNRDLYPPFQKLQERIDKSQKKFKIADTNNDGKMSRDEFAFFRHPEESRDLRLQDIAVDEVMGDMDQNKDG